MTSLVTTPIGKKAAYWSFVRSYCVMIPVHQVVALPLSSSDSISMFLPRIPMSGVLHLCPPMCKHCLLGGGGCEMASSPTLFRFLPLRVLFPFPVLVRSLSADLDSKLLFLSGGPYCASGSWCDRLFRSSLRRIASFARDSAVLLR